jgi:cyclophilin family peptidyl-prolyl cis-trans isomerase
MKMKIVPGFLLGLFLISACAVNPDNSSTPAPAASSVVTGSQPTAIPSANVTTQPTAVPTVAAPTPTAVPFDTAKDYRIEMVTNMGTIKLKLFAKEAPKTVENFTRLSAKGYYNGLTFHRVIPDFMIQGGDPKGDGTGGQSIFGDNFKDEFSPNLSFVKKGQIAMANSGPNTNGSQFFITLKATDWLDGKHTIFGEVTDGLAVLDAIAAVQTGADDKPVKAVIMTKVTVSTQ